MKTEIKLPVEIESAMRRLRDDSGLYGSLVPIIDNENDLTVSDIQENRLNFPKEGPTQATGLRHQSGRLFKSIRRSNAVTISGGVLSGIGSNVKYLGVHEYGFDGDVQVRPYMRTRKQRQVIFGSKRVARLGDVPVRAHQRHMRFPERAPIRRGINARLGNYRESIRAGVIAFYSGK